MVASMVGRRSRALMVLGTASHVGKSIVTAGLGRILADDGYRVAPFKAQNMSLNSAATPDGREIGRAQALQAEACRAIPTADMNPILIKPSSDTSAQIVVLGKVWDRMSAADYHEGRVEELVPLVLESYARLSAEYDTIIIEGAGSPAEINLKAHDIVNMRMARAANAACVLVGDIDRGGVFASLVGTLELLPPDERMMIRGFIINKFRGDMALLEPGTRMIEERIRIPCAGVIPYIHDLGLDEEDGVALEERRTVARAWQRVDSEDSTARPLRIGVVAFPHLANFTDFDPLAMEPSVAIAFLENPSDVRKADLLILPGTKQTLDDLEWMHRTGFTEAIREFRHAKGGRIIGICGGMQVLGARIEDPAGMENDGTPRAMCGLDMLPITTVFNAEKLTRMVTGHLLTAKLWRAPAPTPRFRGYEIHLGETHLHSGAAFSSITRVGESSERLDGCVSEDGLVIGTYVHGLFDEDVFRHAFIDAARGASGLSPSIERVSASANRERRIDRLAGHLRASLDIPLIRSWLQ
jgi:adenosylcobyric acid synthase